jgi:hypothetical protein
MRIDMRERFRGDGMILMFAIFGIITIGGAVLGYCSDQSDKDRVMKCIDAGKDPKTCACAYNPSPISCP